MRIFLYSLFFFFCFSINNAIAVVVLFDDQPVECSATGTYPFGGREYTIERTGNSVSMTWQGNAGKPIVLGMKTVPPISLHTELDPKVRIQVLKDLKEEERSLALDLTWQLDIRRDPVLRRLGSPARTISYAAHERVQVKFEGPKVIAKGETSHVTMDVSAEDGEFALEPILLGTVPFDRISTPEPDLRFITREGAFQGVCTVRSTPNIEQLRKDYGVELTEVKSSMREEHETTSYPLLGDFDRFKNGYVKIEESTSPEHTKPPLCLYVDDNRKFHCVHHRNWKIPVEGPDVPTVLVTSLHSTPLLVNCFERCLQQGHVTPGYYEMMEPVLVDDVQKVTLRSLLGRNTITFDWREQGTRGVHRIDLSQLDPTPESLEALVLFVRNVEQKTIIAYQPEEKHGGLEAQGDFILSLLKQLSFKGEDQGFSPTFENPNPLVIFKVDGVRTSSKQSIGPTAMGYFKSIGVKTLYPGWLKLYSLYRGDRFYSSCEYKSYSGFEKLWPTRIQVGSGFKINGDKPNKQEELEFLEQHDVLIRLITGNGRLREVNLGSIDRWKRIYSLCNIYHSERFKKFAHPLLESGIRKITLEDLIVSDWARSGLSKAQLSKLVCCAHSVKDINLQGRLCSPKEVHDLLRKSPNVKSFEINLEYWDDMDIERLLCFFLDNCKNLSNLTLRNIPPTLSNLAIPHAARNSLKKTTIDFTKRQWPQDMIRIGAFNPEHDLLLFMDMPYGPINLEMSYLPYLKDPWEA